ncbi:9635_t:CDS:2 [Ambispora gerdemannii]|uniref:9635_t:CDS:1 n=1 Tax=Ambispora gerdemannii TaxID=144530 RepID=A0A9N8W3J0_9GLOM|nr:9635_t:CDS:2 [Ambispora gerdemannii]
MYCMRWFIPLLLLPFPNAPPFFVLTFLISYFLHQRPCVYCTILLLALFSSTCYWGQGRCWLDLNQGDFLNPRTTTMPTPKEMAGSGLLDATKG